MNNNKIKKIKLINYSTKNTGSYGLMMIEEDNMNYIYKLMAVSDNIIISKNNILELVYYNLKFPFYNGNLNIYETQIIDYNTFINKYDVDEINIKFLFLKNCLVNKIILIKMDLYKSTLYTAIHNKQINNKISTFKNIVQNIIFGIDKLHSNNLIHGDIKSTNILFNNDLDVVLIDFGGIKHINNKKYNKTCTLTTRAPEELIYEVNSGFVSDIWSLGLVFCEILFRKNPIIDLYNIYSNYDETIIEKHFRNYYMNKKGILIKVNGYYVNNNNYKFRENEYMIFSINDKYIIVNNELIKLVSLIENMLVFDYQKRINNIKSVYNIIYDANYNNTINKIIYNNTRSLNIEYYKDRKLIFQKLIDKIKIIDSDLIFLIPYSIKIIDKYFSEYNYNDFTLLNDNDKKIVLYCGLMAASLFLENYEISHNIVNILGLDINKETEYMSIFIDFITDLHFDLYINSNLINNRIDKNNLMIIINKILDIL